MKAILRWIILYAAPELKPIIDRVEPAYDPAALDRIAAEHKTA
jgi:hypothetical protein